ncbi:uncharacterized protein LOC119165689 [Rhipicephalus microplus]|uniref:uncharacterized protein LOC119165689 n=1 Tax=Rhipicephalus microplus TaxID=6941 RepID=UPI003F6B0142
MARALPKVLIVTLAFLARQGKVLGNKQITYPEVRSDLQKYQDVSKCYPDVGEWICLFRNYYEDPDFGGNANCLSFKRFGAYQNFTTNVVFTFGEHGKANTTGKFQLTSSPCYQGRDIQSFTPDSPDVPLEDFYVIYVDCASCVVIRHRYANDGYGCSLWRRKGTLSEPNDCCEFIYDENCGSTPKYSIYGQSCDF